MVRLLRLGGRNPSSSCNLYEKRKIHIYFYTLAPEKKNSHLATLLQPNQNNSQLVRLYTEYNL